MPILTLNKLLLIESINPSFVKQYRFFPTQLIGKHLSVCIDHPESHQVDQSPEEQGAYQLYSKMNEMIENKFDLQQITYTIYLKNIYGSKIRVITTAIPGKAANNDVSNVILFVEDRRETEEIEAKMKEKKNLITHLKDQLVPPEILNFTQSLQPLQPPYHIKSCVVVTLYISNSSDIFRRSPAHLVQVIDALVAYVTDFPNFFVYTISHDSIYIIGGVSSFENQCSNAINLSKGLSQTIFQYFHVEEKKKKFSISLVYGGSVFIHMTKGHNIERTHLIGDIIDISDIMNSFIPSNSIVIHSSLKPFMSKNDIDGSKKGPEILQSQTLLL